MRLLNKRFPELRALELPLLEADAQKVLELYEALLPTIYVDARGAATRSALVRLRDAAFSAATKEAATRAIAVSDLADGMPDRARLLRGDPEWGTRWQEQADALDAAYGGAIASRDWSDRSRGASVLWYMEEHPEQVQGKAILHVAPEPELHSFLRSTAGHYVGLDATGGAGIDAVADLCDTGLASDRFDLVVCHRVLEHVVDDARAMREMHRVLRPGGLFQISVPQAVHRPRTLEWIVPDLSQHGHVRLYGADLTARLEAAGFTVALEDWLLRQSDSALEARGAYPMRFYWAQKAS